MVETDINIKNEQQLGASKHLIKQNTQGQLLTLDPGSYSVISGGKVQKEFSVSNGGIYSLLVLDRNGNVEIQLDTLLPAFTLNIFLQVPQIFVLSVAEIMVSITGIAFAYSQAPESMKSLLQAGWFLTIFGGNFIDVIIISSKSIKILWVELLFFAGLIFLSIIPFILLARRYKYVNEEESSKTESE